MTPRFQLSRALPLAVVAAMGATGCSSPPPERPDGPEVPDPSTLARELAEGSELEAPARITFRWELREPDVRMSGEGLARVEPPYRARMDLFSEEHWETVSSAALVEHDLRVARDARDDVIPTPALLWAALGVFHPEPGMALVDGRWLNGEEGAGVALEYRNADGEGLRFLLPEGDQVRAAELLRNGRVVEEVELAGEPAARFPGEARYRNMEDTRELRIVLDSVEHVESFAEHIWDPRD